MAGLTKKQIDAAKPRQTLYKLTDERGLCLLVTPTGGKLWRLRFRWGHKQKTNAAGEVVRNKKGEIVTVSRERMISLGVYPDVDLAAAREKRDAERKLIAAKISPADKRRAEKLADAETFGAVALEWLAKQKPGLAAITYDRAVWMLTKLAAPVGSKPVAAVTSADVLAVINRIEAKGNYVTARRTLQRIGAVMRFAVASGRAGKDVTADMVKTLARIPKARKHAAITKPDEIGQLLRAIDGYQGHGVTLYALKLAPYLFVRPGELRHAEWTEFDIEGAAQWLIPAGKMKMSRPHLVPLARQVVVLLRELHALTGPTRSRKARYLFPALTTGQRPMSENTENTALRRLGYSNEQMTAHGFRSMASTRLNEGFNGHHFNRDWIEMQLAHAERDKVRDAYNEAEYLPQRREMMQLWADYLDELRAQQPAKADA